MSSIFPLVLPPLQPVPTPPQLTVKWVLQTWWFSHVRHHVSTVPEDRFQRQTSRQTHNRYEICGGCGSQGPVAYYAVGQYDDPLHPQTLRQLVAFCPACRAVKHSGVAEMQEHLTEAQAHLTEVNERTGAETAASLTHVWSIRENRSQRPWTLTLSWVEVLALGGCLNARLGACARSEGLWCARSGRYNHHRWC